MAILAASPSAFFQLWRFNMTKLETLAAKRSELASLRQLIGTTTDAGDRGRLERRLHTLTGETALYEQMNGPGLAAEERALQRVADAAEATARRAAALTRPTPHTERHARLRLVDPIAAQIFAQAHAVDLAAEEREQADMDLPPAA
jgi:hypothetical protein